MKIHPFILLENSQGSPTDALSLYFENPINEIFCADPQQLMQCLEQIEILRGMGYYLVGYVSYEASYVLDNLIIKDFEYNQEFPLLHFFAYTHCRHFTKDEVTDFLQNISKNDEPESFAYNIRLNISQEDYQNNFNKIQKHLLAGNTYQVNYTCKLKFDVQGSPIILYQQLREQQQVEYAALFYLPQYQLLSLSPELFFLKQNDNLLTKPMKGTMPRSTDLECDLSNKKLLTTDPKLIAENIIIVDLLRNDLSTISLPGSVVVSKLLHVETYATIYQTTSTIQSKVDPATTFKTVVQNLFPAGSITGAPKRKTMQIIHECEQEPRNIYTGMIGYITPTNDMCFNVAIRTLLLRDSHGELGIGGGIVVDSNVVEELDELTLKARFFIQSEVNFKLIETIKYTLSNGYFLLSRHLERLKNSAKILNFVYDESGLTQQLQNLQNELTQPSYKVRIVLHKNGQFDISSVPLQAPNMCHKNWVMLYTQETVRSKNVLLQHKTIDSSTRNFYLQTAQRYSQFFDVIFMNERGEITESSRANIFIQLNGKLITPPPSCGLLAGTMRSKILQDNLDIQQQCIYPRDLDLAEKIWLTNSIHEIEEVSLWKN